jgi:hypothetical protein
MLLLIGALLGLFAQEASFASVPVAQSVEQADADAAMEAACMKAMGQSDESSDVPCKGLTLDCIAKMGCALPLAQAPIGHRIAESPLQRAVLFVMDVMPLIGRDSGPEPDPPSILG